MNLNCCARQERVSPDRQTAVSTVTPSLRLAAAAVLVAIAPVSPPEYVVFTGAVPVSQVLSALCAPRAESDEFFLH